MSLPPVSDAVRRELIAAEVECFRVISTAICNQLTILPMFTVADCLAVRSYREFKRSFNDIDLVFCHTVDPTELLALAKSLCAQQEILTPEAASGRFIRIKYYLPNLAVLGEDFRIDLHIGGIWHRDQCFTLEDKVIRGSTRRAITARGDAASVALPVPKVEDLALLKIEKFIGKDKQDLLSLCCTGDLDCGYLAARAHERGTTACLLKHVGELLATYERQVETWVLDHGVAFQAYENSCRSYLTALVEALS